MIKRVIITLALTSAMLFSVSNIAKAEIKFNKDNKEHYADTICLATFSVTRDLLFNKDMEAYKIATDYQNALILKYAYSKEMNGRVDVLKQHIQNTWKLEQLSNSAEKCMKLTKINLS